MSESSLCHQILGVVRSGSWLPYLIAGSWDHGVVNVKVTVNVASPDGLSVCHASHLVVGMSKAFVARHHPWVGTCGLLLFAGRGSGGGQSLSGWWW